MKGDKDDFFYRLKYTFYSTIVFLLITNPITYKFTQHLFDGSLSILQNGMPTTIGYMFHSFLFFLVLLSVLMFPSHFS
jgi:hypothetical protein